MEGNNIVRGEEHKEAPKPVQQVTKTANVQMGVTSLPTNNVTRAKMSSNTPIARIQSSEKLPSAIYIPVGQANDGRDPDDVWVQVVQAFDDLPLHDYVVQDFDAHSMKFFMNTFMLARTRLLYISDTAATGDLNLELRKLEGDGFTFTDEYRQFLENRLQAAFGTADEQKANPADSPENDPMNFADFTDPSAAAVVESWLEDLRPGTDLVYDKQRVYGALSSFGWNSKNAENKAYLMQHADTIVERTINVLRHVQLLQVHYFAAVCLHEFSGPQLQINWDDISVLMDVLKEWTKTQEEVASDSVKNHVDPQMVREISRSREVVRLLMLTLLKLEGVEFTEQPSRALKRKIKNTFTKRDFSFAVGDDIVANVKTILIGA